MKRRTVIAALIVVPLFIFAQYQQHFKKQLPAGNYSGICAIGNNQYAVVDDKATTDGFRVIHIEIDSIKQRITKVEDLGYRSSGLPNRDMEGICFRPSSQTIFISGEADNEVYEYYLNGQRTGQKLQIPEETKKASHNFGIESLTYDPVRHLFYCTTERPLNGDSVLHILVFNDNLELQCQYNYQPDAPISRKHYYGVSELCALADGRLIVMERQIRIPRLKIGASTITRLYEITPEEQPFPVKRIVTEFKTRFNITSRKFANYEGCCQISDHLLLLISDSQNQYKGLLRDWFRIISID